ncbi:unnamed protein product [Peronospora farinosa]|uniref:UBC core domain-containing protein n=1 Tax=Peronospora farinosa TaxID=134698 RepID=A0ABN8CHS5_9STRA|nr:unnamed protein product [Peronospora farinosa]
MAATVRNTAVKRIQGDVREMMTNPSDQYTASPLETNMFDWHFTLRGPHDTEFEGGIYHGRIILPSDYPFKPPNIILLTPNGRFEVKKENLSQYFSGEGAIGALDFSADERKRLAKLSINYKCETCGRVADLLPELKLENEHEKTPSKTKKEAENVTVEDGEHVEEAKTTFVDAHNSAETQEEVPVDSKPASMKKDPSIDADGSTSTRDTVSALAEESAEMPAVTQRHQNVDTPIAAHDIVQVRGSDSVDTLLHYLTVAIVIALFALIYKKLLQTYGVLQ